MDQLSSWVRENIEAVGSPAQLPASPFNDFPGFYLARGSGYTIGVDVSEDGTHIDELRVKAHLLCGRRYATELDVRGAISEQITNRVVHAEAELAPSRRWKRGKMWLYLRFDELGEAEGILTARQSPRHQRLACHVIGLRFSAQLV